MLLADGAGVSTGVAVGIGAAIKSLVLGIGMANAVIIFAIIGLIIAVIVYIRYVLPARIAVRKAQEVKAKEQNVNAQYPALRPAECVTTIKQFENRDRLLEQRIAYLERTTEQNCAELREQLEKVYAMETSHAETNGEVSMMRQSIGDMRSTVESISDNVRMLIQHLLPRNR